MAGLNKISLIGNLGRDPEVRYTQDGLAVTNFSMAVSEKFKEKGESKERTLWFKVTAFGKLGEICGQYLTKGKQVYIEGRLQTSEWTDKEGKNRFSLEVVASQMVMLGSANGNGQATGTESPEYKPKPSIVSETPAMPAEDDIPF